jgi:PEP-CTERM motif
MRKSIVALAVLAVAFMLTAMSATAQTGISLSTSSTSGITFTPTGLGNQSMDVGVFGSAAGLGSLLGTTGYYSLTGGPTALTLGANVSPIFADYSASGPALDFEVTSGPGGTGTDLLMGSLSLVDLVQVTSTGMTNTSAQTDITITGGSLQSHYSGNTGVAQLTIDLTGLGFLPSLGTATATDLRAGTLDALVATPEPASMLLFGSALVLVGIILRRRHLEQS